MAYEKQTWTDGSTPVDASHMSHIEDGIAQVEEAAETEVQSEATARENADDELKEQLQEQIDELNDSLANQRYFTSLDDLVAFSNTLSVYQIRLVYISNTVMSTLGGNSGISKGFIAKGNSTADCFDFVFELTQGAQIYTGRYNQGTIILYRYSGTSIS